MGIATWGGEHWLICPTCQRRTKWIYHRSDGDCCPTCRDLNSTELEQLGPPALDPAPDLWPLMRLLLVAALLATLIVLCIL